MRGHHKTTKLDCDWRQGTAYIVETRNHPNLLSVLENADQFLPKEWLIVVFCSIENHMHVDEVKSAIVGRRVLVKSLDCSLVSLADYHNLLFSVEFWQQFETENLLELKINSWLSVEQKKLFTDIVKYDYVSSLTFNKAQKISDSDGLYEGRGGICFSKRSARLNALSASEVPQNTVSLHEQAPNNNAWFLHAINQIKGRLPSEAQTNKWFGENGYSKKTFALDKPWVHLSEEQFNLLCAKNFGLKKIKDGSDKPMLGSNGEGHVQRNFLLRFARHCLGENNFYQADLSLQLCQQRYPSHHVAFNLQAMLAHRLGLYSQGLNFVNKALKRKPDFEKALDNKRILTELNQAESNKGKSTSSQSEQRYMLIHSWGSGLGFDLLYLLKQLMVAELTDRKPVIYWGENSLYNDHPNSDCFTRYFENISQATLTELEPLKHNCYPKFWQQRELKNYIRRTRWRDTKNNHHYLMSGLYYLNRPERLVIGGEFTTVKTLLSWVPQEHRLYGLSVNQVYRDLMGKYIKPKEFLQSKVNDFIDNKVKQKDFIAIHLRGTDKKQEKQSADIESININLVKQVSKLDETLPIFVMTDDVRQIELMKKRFGQRVRSIDVTRTDGNEFGVHHTAEDKSKIAHEVIIDMCIAAKAKYFFGCGFSYLACCVDAMRSENQITVLQPFDLMNRFIDVPTPGKFGIK